MKEIKNSEIFLRPRFKIGVLKNSDELLTKFKNVLNDENCPLRGKIAGNHIFLDVPKGESRFWSPHLQLELEEISDKKTLVKGLFGPKPQLWTFFMFIHFFIAVAFIGFSIMFYVQNALKNDTTLALSIVILMPIAWFALYFFGRYAKYKAKKQMHYLHRFMEKVLVKD